MRRRRWRGTVVSGNLAAAVLVPEPEHLASTSMLVFRSGESGQPVQ